MTSMYTALTTLLLAVGGGTGVAPDGGDRLGTVTGLQILPAAERTEVLIAVDGRVETRDFTMEGPDRLVLDLLGARYALPSESLGTVGRGGIRTVRASQYSPDVVRIVLELDVPVGYELLAGDGYIRVSLENLLGEFEPWSVSADRTVAAAQPPVPEVGTPNGRNAAPANRPSGAWRGLQSQEFARRVSVTFVDAPMREVLFTFADLSNRSIVPGAEVAGTVNADIRDQPWDIALLALLDAYGLAAQEQASGIIRVDRLETLRQREEQEPVLTRSLRVNFGNAQQLLPAVQNILTPERGRAVVSASTNSIVVTDIQRVVDSVEDLITGLDVQTPEVTISAKIIFVNRTDLQEFGIVYDLKDSRGNQLNSVTPGAIDRDGDGRISEDEFVEIGTNVVSLGGSSIAALGNAQQRVVNPSLQFLTSLILGRHTLITFVEALQSVNLSDVQAAPQIRVLDNTEAKILVGERTPIRVIDAAGGGAAGQQGQGAFPQATVDIQETGIVLQVTPHVTTGDLILLDLRAERSGVEIADADIGFIFNTQEAQTRVLVENGETVVIGGLTVTERTEVRSGIPLLKDLPLVGRLFRLTREQRNQRDLMILVTPQINRR